MANNVLGTKLEDCSTDPMTGYFRDGCCRTDVDGNGVDLTFGDETFRDETFGDESKQTRPSEKRRSETGASQI